MTDAPRDEFSPFNPALDEGRVAIGSYTMPGRADMAHLADNPKSADPEQVELYAGRVAATLPVDEREGYERAVAKVFPPRS